MFLRRVKWTGHAERTGEVNTKLSAGNPEGKRHLGQPWRRREDILYGSKRNLT
jgi:hypothetical protein